MHVCVIVLYLHISVLHHWTRVELLRSYVILVTCQVNQNSQAMVFVIKSAAEIPFQILEIEIAVYLCA